MISSSPAKKPEAGSMELGGSLFSSTSWLEFFGPGREVEEVVEVVELEVVVVEVVELLGWVGTVVEVVELLEAGPETETK